MKHYDYLVVGAGLYGAVFAYEAKKRGKEVLVIDRRDHKGGNIYCEEVNGINVHKYGAHIFHTSNKKSMGVCKPVCRVQQIHKLAGCELQRRII